MKKFRKLINLCIWIAIWEALSLLLDNEILLASPLRTLVRLFELLGESSFYRTVFSTLLRIAAGLIMGTVVGILLAIASAQSELVKEFLKPAIVFFKTVPVASFVVLLLIWWGSRYLSVAISFLVVMPQIYVGALQGIEHTDAALLEMARVYRLPAISRLFYIYMPSVKPFLYSSLKIALGMCWKSGVAAEVIGTPDFSIGGGLYLSKIYLDTAGVFAWTLVVIGLSVIFEKGILRLCDLLFQLQPACKKPFYKKEETAVSLKNVSKEYGEIKVLKQESRSYEAGSVSYLNSPSGSGKTTTLRILAGLETVEEGMVEHPAMVSMMFQEDRLCMEYDAVKNVELVTGNREAACEALRKLLEEDALHRPCAELSGGMKRRVALVRAMEASADLVLLDEPFTGMDALTREAAQAYIRERQDGRTIVIATHI